MESEELIQRFPYLYHMTECGGWEGIGRHGLLSTSALLDLFEYRGEDRRAIECAHRPAAVRLHHPRHGTAVIRDQRPLSGRGLERCLRDGLRPQDWYRILNRKAFLWLSPQRLQRLLDAKNNRDRAHEVITVETRGLVRDYQERIRLSPINSGSASRHPRPRGADTFLPIQAYPYAYWRARRPAWDGIVELAVEGGVPTITDYVVRVERIHGRRRLALLWER